MASMNVGFPLMEATWHFVPVAFIFMDQAILMQVRQKAFGFLPEPLCIP
jgi:hypothetical protein